MITTYYKIPSPNGNKENIEVYGDGEMGWYEYRIMRGAIAVIDTGKESGTGREYGCAEIALRDALMFATDISPK